METYADEWAVSCCLLTVSNMSKAIKLIVRFIQTIKHSYDIFEKKGQPYSINPAGKYSFLSYFDVLIEEVSS